MNILLVRHGEIPSNVKKVYAGKSAESLTPRGIAQAERVAGMLASCNIHALYSSPVRRAIQTAEIIGRRVQKNVLVDSAFREMELGPWEGLSEDDVAHMFPEEWTLWHTKPAELALTGREMLAELLERVLAGIRCIYQSCAESDVVIVTHVAIIRVLLLWHSKNTLNLYKTIDVPNARVFKIRIDRHHVL